MQTTVPWQFHCVLWHLKIILTSKNNTIGLVLILKAYEETAHRNSLSLYVCCEHFWVLGKWTFIAQQIELFLCHILSSMHLRLVQSGECGSLHFHSVQGGDETDAVETICE